MNDDALNERRKILAEKLRKGERVFVTESAKVVDADSPLAKVKIIETTDVNGISVGSADSGKADIIQNQDLENEYNEIGKQWSAITAFCDDVYRLLKGYDADKLIHPCEGTSTRHINLMKLDCNALNLPEYEGCKHLASNSRIIAGLAFERMKNCIE